MKTSKVILSAALATFLSLPAHAGFGDLLKEVESAGKDILKETTQSTTNSGKKGGGLDYNTLVAGLKDALDVGSRRAVESLSQTDGYMSNALARIPLPEQLEKASSLLRKFGLGDQVDQFELSMNRAAEKAAPQATEIIVSSIKEMSIEDAEKILNGPDNAATEYFRSKTSARLTELFKPTIKSSMEQVGATRYYGQLSQEANKVPLVGDVAKGYNLEDHVTNGALDGLFNMLAAEEKKIRENPAARTTELLKQVFK